MRQYSYHNHVTDAQLGEVRKHAKDGSRNMRPAKRREFFKLSRYARRALNGYN